MSEIPVESNEQRTVLDDAALQPVQPETEPVSPITEITEEPQPEQQQKEPGYIRQRIDKAVAKALADQRAEFERMLEPLRDSMYERQAAQLVEQGEFKSQERALEYVRMKAGASVSAVPQPEPEPTPRDEQGRFVPREDPKARARAELLSQQAEKIKNNRGIDVMQTFNDDPTVQQKVLSGEWDFYDVAEYHRPMAPMRSPNGANTGAFNVSNMSDEQFDRLLANLAAGKKYDAR